MSRKYMSRHDLNKNSKNDYINCFRPKSLNLPIYNNEKYPDHKKCESKSRNEDAQETEKAKDTYTQKIGYIRRELS